MRKQASLLSFDWTNINKKIVENFIFYHGKKRGNPISCGKINNRQHLRNS